MRFTPRLPLPSPRSFLLGCAVLAAGTAVHAQTDTPSFSFGDWFDGPSWLDDTGKPLQWGRFEVTPSFTYNFSHSEGQPGRSFGSSGSTSSHQFAPSVAVQMGRQWSFSYNPTWTKYTSGRYSSKLNHRLRLGGAFHAGITSFSVNQSYTKTDSVELETGTQTNQQSWNTGVSASVPIRQQIGLQFSGSYAYRDAASYSSSESWQGTTSVTTQPFPKVSTNIGATFGTTKIDPGYNQDSFRYFVGSSWALARKITASGSIGHSERKVDMPGASKSTGLTYDASVDYHPLPHTSLSLGLAKTFGGSAISARLTEVERVTVGVGQRLFGRFNLNLTYSVGTTKYISPLSPVTRTDDTERYSAQLSTSLSKRISVRAFYRNTENTSSSTGFGVDSQQYGFGLTYRY